MAEVLDRPPTRRLFDVDAYYRMAETGILPPGARVELIEGEIVDMAPIGSNHAGTTDQLGILATPTVSQGLVHLAIQRPLRLDARNEPEPDMMLLRPRPDFYKSSHPTAADVLLLIEVADTSLAIDRGAKLASYARHGVPEVWVVDLVGRAIEVCREPRGEVYAKRERVSEGRVVAGLVQGFQVDVTSLFAS